MPLIIAVHKMKKEDFKIVSKKIIEMMQQVPEGMSTCAAYTTTDRTEAWCVWEAESADQVEDFLKKAVPEMSTEAKPILQFFPPGPDLYKMLYALVSQ